MIAKMSFISITGPRDDMDRIVDKYLSKYEIQLEYAPSEMKTLSTLYPYVQSNPYKEQLGYAEELTEILGKPQNRKSDMSLKESLELVEELYHYIKSSKNQIEEFKSEIESLNDKLNSVLPFKNIDYNIEDIINFKSMRFRFGRIPKENYIKFTDYIQDDITSVFLKAAEDNQYVWGIYFVAKSEKESVDAAYTSLHFERTYFPYDVHGTMKEIIDGINEDIRETEEKLRLKKEVLGTKIERNKEIFANACYVLRRYSLNFDVRKYAACTKEDGLAYYILCGWMAKEDSRVLNEEITMDEPDTICIVDERHEATKSKPPTKLKNFSLIKPFEMFIKMYGMPAYNELDPTLFVAITYAIIFGAMFGDVGQGLCLFIGGLIIYKIKKMDLAAIIASAGFFSTIFGFLYGSFFGFEDVIPHMWLSPAKAMTNLPFVGRLNTVFVVAVALGMFIIIFAQVMHIINAIKAKDIENKWFDANGAAGLVFYLSIVVTIILFMTGNELPAGIVMAIMFGLPLILIAFKEPITHLIMRKKKLIDGGIGMFLTQTFFEMFEVLLSYFSNTLSFIRVGAFAVSHAAMMEVVLMLAGAENGGTGNIVVIIIGNIFVCALEGLIVGIQVLRLEYYEIFSRFYKGTGREFKPYIKKNKNY